MPLHKRYAQQLGRTESNSCVVPIDGMDCLYALSLTNTVFSRYGDPNPVDFTSTIDNGLITGDLKCITKAQIKKSFSEDTIPGVLVTLRTGVEEERSYEFCVSGADIADHVRSDKKTDLINAALDKIVAQVTRRIEEALSYTVFR